MTAALEEGEWSAARPSCTLPPGKTQCPLYRRLGGPQGRSGRVENLAPPGFDPRTIQPVVSRYTDWATRPTNEAYVLSFSKNVWFLIIFQLDNVQLFNIYTYQIPLFNGFFYGTHYTVAVLCICMFVLNSSVVVTEKEMTGWKIFDIRMSMHRK